MENEVPEKKKRSLKDAVAHLISSKRKLVLVIIAIVVVIGIIAAFVTGWLTVVAKSPSQKVVVVSVTCSESMVEKYNTIMTNFYTDQLSEKRVELKSLGEEIKKISSYDTDSNCVFISYQIAYLNNDYQTAKAMIDRLAELVTKGHPLNGNLTGLSSIDDMERTINQIKPSTSSAEDSNE